MSRDNGPVGDGRGNPEGCLVPATYNIFACNGTLYVYAAADAESEPVGRDPIDPPWDRTGGFGGDTLAVEDGGDCLYGTGGNDALDAGGDDFFWNDKTVEGGEGDDVLHGND